MKRTIAMFATCATLGAVQVQAQAPLAFVTCPIMRDTATVPCWLAEFEGELYYLVIQEDSSAAVYPPSLGHQALIEGTPTEERRCGGKVLTNLHISIRPERDPSCNTILPATEQYQITDHPRGPGPSNARPEPARSAPPAVRRPPAAPALKGTQRFEVLYDFDWQTAGRNTRVIQDAAAYAKASEGAEVVVIGYRASVALANGQVLEEAESIGERRARELVKTLVTLGVDQAVITESGEVEAELGDHTRRRALIAVVMSGDDPHTDH